MQARRRWGCHGGGTVTHFATTPYATDTCPRRLLLQNSDVAEVYTIRRRVGEHPGLSIGEQLTTMAMDALDVVDDAVAWRHDEEIEKSKRDANADRELRGRA